MAYRLVLAGTIQIAVGFIIVMVAPGTCSGLFSSLCEGMGVTLGVVIMVLGVPPLIAGWVLERSMATAIACLAFAAVLYAGLAALVAVFGVTEPVLSVMGAVAFGAALVYIALGVRVARHRARASLR